jgi:hypothetical protein
VMRAVAVAVAVAAMNIMKDAVAENVVSFK